jgi:Flp pilus assembly protein TadD
MLLQPDARLFSVPAEGGEPRELEANLASMNSWHSFSPNGRWLVFASKAPSPYTQLMLTHFDAEGRTTPPIWLSWFVAPERAANIPEFANLPAGVLQAIDEDFLDDTHYTRMGYLSVAQFGDFARSASFYEQALRSNPRNSEALRQLGLIAIRQQRHGEAIARFEAALALHEADAEAQHGLGVALLVSGQAERAARALERAVELEPGNGRALLNLAKALAANPARLDEAVSMYARALALLPDDFAAHLGLGKLWLRLGRKSEARAEFDAALRLAPEDPVLQSELRRLAEPR